MDSRLSQLTQLRWRPMMQLEIRANLAGKLQQHRHDSNWKVFAAIERQMQLNDHVTLRRYSFCRFLHKPNKKQICFKFFVHKYINSFCVWRYMQVYIGNSLFLQAIADHIHSNGLVNSLKLWSKKNLYPIKKLHLIVLNVFNNARASFGSHLWGWNFVEER